MGFSSTVGTIIVLSTLLVCAIYLYTSLDTNISKVYKAYADYIELENKKLRERLEIISISVNTSTNTINITVKNNGSVILEPSKWTVLYNGTPVNFSVDPDVKYLFPLNSITVSINATTPAKLCIVSEYGNRYYYHIY